MQEDSTGDAANLPLALTCGDPAGIGPEVIAAALRNQPALRRNCVLLGPVSWAKPLATEWEMAFEAVGPPHFELQPGQPSVEGARVACAALQLAAQGCLDRRFGGVVSAPVSKHWLQQSGFQHLGQTEFFAAAWGGEPSMGFVGNRLRVVLATWHIPLSAVPGALTPDCLERAVWRAARLAQSFGLNEPRIAVCGLNPHAGESGLLGSEERDVLDPTLDRLRIQIPGLSHCLPGDTAFFRQLRGEFDVVVAAYHDQGLAAVKTLEFDAAVNVTLGLPFVRTSPDHGTAFEIAGQGVADCGSFDAALSLAWQLTSQ